jgi:hypothetical protein
MFYVNKQFYHHQEILGKGSGFVDQGSSVWSNEQVANDLRSRLPYVYLARLYISFFILVF